MKTRLGMMVLVTIVAALVMVNTAQAVLVDFEAGGYTLATDGAASLVISTEQAASATHSAKMTLSDASPSSDFAKITVPFAGALGLTSGTFNAYIPSTSSALLAPYMYFIVDANNSGTYDFPNDSLIIDFITGGTPNPQDSWFQSGLNSTTTVHVVGERAGLGATEFSSSGTQDTLANLAARTFSGSVTWGDLNIWGVRVGAGEWPGPGAANYTAYVDDINVTTSVPEPGTLLLLGSGLLGLVVAGRKKFRK